MKKIILLFLITVLITLSCTKGNEETPNTSLPDKTPIVFNKLKAYKNNIYYDNNSSADWHKITQSLDTINNTITQDSAQYNKPNIKTTYKVISSSYYENYNNSNTDYMIYLINGSPFKYIMVNNTTDTGVVVFKKFKTEVDIIFSRSSIDGEYYIPVKK